MGEKAEKEEKERQKEIHFKTKLTTSAKAEITFPNVVRDLLMFAPSCKQRNYYLRAIKIIIVNSLLMLGVCDGGSLTFSLVPLAPVESARSLPAKSTRLILLT